MDHVPRPGPLLSEPDSSARSRAFADRRSGRLRALSCLFAVGLILWTAMPDPWFAGWPLRIREVLRHEGLNGNDYARRERGYYEALLEEDRVERNPGIRLVRLGGTDTSRGTAEPFETSPLVNNVEDIREYVLKPNLRTRHLGATWQTNSWGLRDQEYERTKPSRTIRIALIGDSIGTGWGVDDGDGFEPRMERRLDRWSRDRGGPRVEILNFAVPGHAPGQRWADFSRHGWEFGIDVVLYEATLADPGWDERRLRSLLVYGRGWDEPLYHDLLVRSGARRYAPVSFNRSILKPWRWQILEHVYRSITLESHARNVPCLWLLIPRVGRPVDAEDRDRLIGLAKRSGFDTCLEFLDVYRGKSAQDLAIEPHDYHPNAEGHRLLTESMYGALTDPAGALDLWWSPETASEHASRDDSITEQSARRSTEEPRTQSRRFDPHVLESLR